MRFSTKGEIRGWHRHFALFPTIVGTKYGRDVWVWLEYYEERHGEGINAHNHVRRPIKPIPAVEPYEYSTDTF